MADKPRADYVVDPDVMVAIAAAIGRLPPGAELQEFVGQAIYRVAVVAHAAGMREAEKAWIAALERNSK
jgi:hypothetical protein